jgi:hypothetical protein
MLKKDYAKKSNLITKKQRNASANLIAILIVVALWSPIAQALADIVYNWLACPLN